MMHQRSTSENHTTFAGGYGHMSTPCDVPRALNHHEMEGSLQQQLVKDGSRVCAWNMVTLIRRAAVCLFSTLTWHVLGVMTAYSAIPVLQNIWKRTSCSLQNPSPLESAHFC